jgi:hypothetical protein
MSRYYFNAVTVKRYGGSCVEMCSTDDENIFSPDVNGNLIQGYGVLGLSCAYCEPKRINKITLQGSMASTRFYLDDGNLVKLHRLLGHYIEERGLQK